MTIEAISATASILSSLIVVVGAVAAVRQLRHLRMSNLMAPLIPIMRRGQSPLTGANFEHLAAVATQWLEVELPRETRRLRRMPPIGPAADDSA